MADPSKAEAFRRYCDRWWLVVSDRAIVKPGELPTGWGLLALSGGTLRAVKGAPRLTPEPLSVTFRAALMRGVAKTYARRGFRDHPGHS